MSPAAKKPLSQKAQQKAKAAKNKKLAEATGKYRVLSSDTKFTFAGQDFVMTPREKHFCMIYVQNGSVGSQAAVEAGYSKHSARAIATEVLSRPYIQRYVAALREDIGFMIGVSATDIAREYKRIGMADVRKVFDPQGNIINVQEIDDETAPAISSVEVFEEYAQGPKGPVYIGKTKKLKMHDKINALDKLAKMLGVDGVTKVANTDTQGKDKEPAAAPPMTDDQVNKILDAVKAREA